MNALEKQNKDFFRRLCKAVFVPFWNFDLRREENLRNITFNLNKKLSGWTMLDATNPFDTYCVFLGKNYFEATRKLQDIADQWGVDVPYFEEAT